MSGGHLSETGLPQLSEHARKNREMWDALSDRYEDDHAHVLGGEQAMAWGNWRVSGSCVRWNSQIRKNTSRAVVRGNPVRYDDVTETHFWLSGVTTHVGDRPNHGNLSFSIL